MARTQVQVNIQFSATQALTYVMNAMREKGVTITDFNHGQIFGVCDESVVPELSLIPYTNDITATGTVTSPAPDDSDGYYSGESSS